MKSFSIIAHPDKYGVATTLNSVIEWMCTHNVEVRLDRSLAELIVKPLPDHLRITSTEMDAVSG